MNRRDALKSLLALPIAVKAVPAVVPELPVFTSGFIAPMPMTGLMTLHGTESVAPAYAFIGGNLDAANFAAHISANSNGIREAIEQVLQQHHDAYKAYR